MRRLVIASNKIRILFFLTIEKWFLFAHLASATIPIKWCSMNPNSQPIEDQIINISISPTTLLFFESHPHPRSHRQNVMHNFMWSASVIFFLPYPIVCVKNSGAHWYRRYKRRLFPHRHIKWLASRGFIVLGSHLLFCTSSIKRRFAVQLRASDIKRFNVSPFKFNLCKTLLIEYQAFVCALQYL